MTKKLTLDHVICLNELCDELSQDPYGQLLLEDLLVVALGPDKAQSLKSLSSNIFRYLSHTMPGDNTIRNILPNAEGIANELMAYLENPSILQTVPPNLEEAKNISQNVAYYFDKNPLLLLRAEYCLDILIVAGNANAFTVIQGAAGLLLKKEIPEEYKSQFRETLRKNVRIVGDSFAPAINIMNDADYKAEIDKILKDNNDENGGFWKLYMMRAFYIERQIAYKIEKLQGIVESYLIDSNPEKLVPVEGIIEEIDNLRTRYTHKLSILTQKAEKIPDFQTYAWVVTNGNHLFSAHYPTTELKIKALAKPVD